MVSAHGNSTAQKFGYNGKELNEELGLEWHDFGARNYDAALGRWTNLDPLAEQYYNTSPYVYALNAPTFFIDPDGREVDVTDLWNQRKDKGKKGDEARWLLAQLVSGLSKISGLDIGFATNKKTGKTILSGYGNGNGKKGEAYVKHLLETDTSEKKSNTIEVKTTSGRLGSTSGDLYGEVFLHAEQINGIQEGLDNAGVDKETMSVGLAFIHETLHSQYGASFFSSKEDQKAKKDGRFLDNGKNGMNLVNKVNIFRKEMRLPNRTTYGINSSFRVSKDGNKSILIKYKKTPIPVIKPKKKG